MKYIIIKNLLPLMAFLAVFNFSAAQTVPSEDIQIKTALLAAPVEMKQGAMVYGYSPSGEFKAIRKGSNALVCLADDPNQKGFNVSCYQKDLDPFMARGRELKKEGKSYQEIFDTREAEVKSGKLEIPKGSILYVYSGKDEEVNWESGEVTNGSIRYVVYLPFETPETTGLPAKPDFAGQPWIMDPGTHRAHIMLTPPKN